MHIVPNSRSLLSVIDISDIRIYIYMYILHFVTQAYAVSEIMTDNFYPEVMHAKNR